MWQYIYENIHHLMLCDGESEFLKRIHLVQAIERVKSGNGKKLWTAHGTCHCQTNS